MEGTAVWWIVWSDGGLTVSRPECEGPFLAGCPSLYRAYERVRAEGWAFVAMLPDQAWVAMLLGWDEAYVEGQKDAEEVEAE